MSLSATTQPTIEISAPRFFTSAAVLKICAFGISLCLPVFAAVIAISLLPASIWTLIVPFLALGITFYLLPFGFGNAYVRKLVATQHPSRQGFVVQLRIIPSPHKGFRTIAEDADDLGFVCPDGEGFSFVGDAVQLRAPLSRITSMRLENCGWRGLFLYGAKITIDLEGFPQARRIELAERSSLTLPQSWRNTRALFAAMERPMQTKR
jgi:hypothetical protein